MGLSSALAIEGARHGILSNVIAPAARTRLTEQLLGAMNDALAPDLVAPLVAYLASERCTLSHEIFSAGGGRFTRVFIGVTPGWSARSGTRPSPEDLLANLDQIRSLEGFTVPQSGPEEATPLLQSLQT